jgi:hypothetical protein
MVWNERHVQCGEGDRQSQGTREVWLPGRHWATSILLQSEALIWTKKKELPYTVKVVQVGRCK